ncbi:MAG TPA: glycosyltransferase family 8 protein [Longimicrobiales bacterium]
MTVVTGANARYALPLAVMLRSTLENLSAGCAMEAWVIDDGLGSGLRGRIEGSLDDRATVHWVDVRAADFEGLPLWGRMTVTCYFKLALGRVLPVETDRAIWLDADLLVLGDLRDLWRADMGGKSVMAARDPFVPSASSPHGVAVHAALGIPGDAPYLNSGVMLVDVRRWREDDVIGSALDYLRRFRERVFFFDQEALNVALHDRWGVLDEGWNRAVSSERLGLGAAGRGAARILHFSGSLKPWNYSSRSRHHELYYAWVDRTAWRGWRPRPTVRGAMLRAYEASRLRRLFHPLENRSLELIARLTRSYSAARNDEGLG